MTGEIDFNSQFIKAYNFLENNKENIFITGKAGTGKSTLLQYFREHTTKNVVILAPTGVAAVNVKGQTIHSFFRFKPDITPDTVSKIRIRFNHQKIFKKVDTIIIDEISMVRADLLDCVDRFLRFFGRDNTQPFGGVQMIFIGDLYQLPPVVNRSEAGIFKDVYASPYFFDAKVMENLRLHFIDLEKIYRQKDDDFIDLLSAIRNKTATGDHLSLLNQRYLPDFNPTQDDFYIYLTTTNAMADQINARYLKNLDSSLFHFEGEIDGNFEQKNLPTKQILFLKPGAQVMLLNNDPEGRWVNGSIGKIIDIEDDLLSSGIVLVELEEGPRVEVTPFTWEMYKFRFNEVSERIESQVAGSFRQYPLKLAWAVTIHKSQGKTFTKVIVDMGEGAFSHGQTYVALSRCTTLDGLILKRPIQQRDILLDNRIKHFMNRMVEL